MFVYAKQVDESLKDDAQVFMVLAFMKPENKVLINELPVVCEFPKVFPSDISDFPP